ncbi:glycosyltransferase family 1 protein [Nocardioides marmorisolisilvae]|uniref:Glycosyltransferase family 1 protein n=1 Tax=Nocardioides marmorisolisilvae TaxID=1542737 RepID=A0A3N0DU18_9ACTN|nr:glycosyltransferase family 1 protein [Nocardioides marmorisolisilvae]RNL79112.1 glycosyltransferase family 1 protein [Nocardioides marmorisolisilvae]
MAVTLIVEPDPSGHRFQAVANVAAVAGETTEVVLLTTAEAAAGEAFDVYLADTKFLAVEPVFDQLYPPTEEIARAIADQARERDVETAVLMDADNALKRWWLVARREFKGLARKPRIVMMLTRYPARIKYTDKRVMQLRISKGLLAMVSRANGTVQHLSGFAGRDDMSHGWVVRRARDPEICSAHSRDRAALRAELDLPADRVLVGIFGMIGPDKRPDLVLEAIKVSGIDGDLVLAGGVKPEVVAWLDGLDEADRARVIVRNGFLSNEVLDKHVAAVNAVPIAQVHGGPSGIMGKASAAGVPVVSAGSEVRAREMVATDSGENAEMTAESIGAAIKRVVERDPDAPRRNTVPPATAEEFSRNLLGVDGEGRFVGMSRR